MQPTDFAAMPCPIARSLARVGERWTMLILRDAFQGMTRFDEFRKSLDIAPNILTRRLEELVDAGLLEKRMYSQHPARYEYLPTAIAYDFRPVMVAMVAWGTRHFSPEGPAMMLVARETGAPVEQRLVDSSNGRILGPDDYVVVPGPAATPRARYRMEFAARKRQGQAPDERFDPDEFVDRIAT
ncbi:transcriptional regulator [Bordetella genomosp. 8]|uniref:Transcriptional regulator n=1 Tax=Bordetella genomosp. 8 TaxID=1416806 RepID=A0A1W6YF29_9BORD|nr:helix-turn-helix domain-containing protein [Bordetella genomosp. 8]ARP79651.1 transcriptional regulator [Bordetella genomosp. 8]